MTRIMTNIAAINAQRNLEATSIKMGKTLEKLSSGYRINRAADDAAGLGISEKMRAQIRGNQQAQRNVQDGISMLQTGEGAMDEVHSMLQRIRELAVQAANGTYTDNGPERTSIGQEIVQLSAEIDRIANSTEFNGQKLLTGNLSVALGSGGLQNFGMIGGAASGTSTGANGFGAGVGVTVAAPATDFGSTPPGSYTLGINGANIELRSGTTVVASAPASTLNIPAGGNGALTFSNGLKLSISNTTAAAYTFTDLQTALTPPKTFVVAGNQVTNVDVASAVPQAYTFTAGAPGTLTLQGADGSAQTVTVPAYDANGTAVLQFSQLGISVTMTGAPNGPASDVITALTGTTVNATGSGAASVLQVGANTPDTLSLNFTNIQTTGLGGGGFTLGGASGLVAKGANGIVATIADAHNLMTAIDGAIQQLNVQRGTLGAAQNRLEHSMASLGVAVENLSASESRIRDADIASLSSEMVSNQILQQAGVSVLSQANQAPQAVLKLLQQ
jgi:flagellin